MNEQFPSLTSPSDAMSDAQEKTLQDKQAKYDPLAHATNAANSMNRYEFLTSNDTGLNTHEERSAFYAENTRKNLSTPKEQPAEVEKESPLFNPNTPMGAVGNAAAQLGSSLFSGVVNIGTAASEIESIIDSAGEGINPETDNALYAATADRMEEIQSLYEAGKDYSHITDKFTSDELSFVQERKDNNESKYEVYREYFEDAERSNSIGDVANMFDKYVDHSKVEKFAAEAGKSYDHAKELLGVAAEEYKNGNVQGAVIKALGAIGGLTGETATGILRNPEATLQILAQSAPEMYAASKNIIVGGLVAFSRTLSGNMRDLRKENEGGPLTGEQQTKAVLASAGEAAVSIIGDKVLTKAGNVKESFPKASQGAANLRDSVKKKVGMKVKTAAEKESIKAARSRLNKSVRATAAVSLNNLKVGSQEYAEEYVESLVGQYAVKQDIDELDTQEEN